MRSIISMFLAASVLLGAAALASSESARSSQDRFVGQLQMAQNIPDAAQARIGAPVILVIGLDLSASNPLIMEGNEGNLFRTKGAKYVKDLITGTAEGIPPLPVGSIVLLRTFGDYNPLHQPIELTVIPVHNKNREIAGDKIREVITELPSYMKKGGLKPQNWTYIVGFLGEMASLVKETGRRHHDSLAASMQRNFEFKTRIVLLSDGIESTPPSGSNKKGVDLEDPKAAKLPEPVDAFNQCEELVILGLGFGGNPKRENASDRVSRVRRAWAQWSKSAGCENFVGKNQW